MSSRTKSIVNVGKSSASRVKSEDITEDSEDIEEEISHKTPKYTLESIDRRVHLQSSPDAVSGNQVVKSPTGVKILQEEESLGDTLVSRKNISPSRSSRFSKSSRQSDDSSDEEIVAPRSRKSNLSKPSRQSPYQNDSDSEVEVVRSRSPTKVSSSTMSLKKSKDSMSKNNFGVGVESTRKYTNVPVGAENVDDILLAAGYTPLKTITSRSNTGTEEKAVYTEAATPVGDIVYVKLDTDQVISVSKDGKTLVKSITASTKPINSKLSLTECANKSNCGILFQCEGEYCAINRSNNMDNIESVYQIVDTRSEKEKEKSRSISGAMKEKSLPVAFPIVSLSSIIQDTKSGSDSTYRSARQATLDLNQTAINEVRTKLTNLRNKDIPALVKSIDEMLSKLSGMEEYKNREVGIAINKMSTLEKTPIKTPEIQRDIKELNDELIERTNSSINTKVTVEKYAEEADRTIKQLLKNAEDMYASLFLYVKETYDPVISKDFKKSSNWGYPDKIDSMSKEEIKKLGSKAGSSEKEKELSRVIEEVV